MHDNSALRAFTWDENRAGVKEKPDGKRNIDGASLGGPIKKNKWFFFANWEGTFERVSNSVLSSVPAPDVPKREISTASWAARFSTPPAIPILVPTTEGGTTPLRRRHDLRSVHRQSGRNRPIGVFERRANQRHSAIASECSDDEDDGAGAAAESVRRQRQLLQHRHAEV